MLHLFACYKIFPMEMINPNPSPTWRMEFGLSWIGASGDIGFTPKASNINGLRAIEQQYLHQNQISALDFEDVPVATRPFYLSKDKAPPVSRFGLYLLILVSFPV